MSDTDVVIVGAAISAVVVIVILAVWDWLVMRMRAEDEE